MIRGSEGQAVRWCKTHLHLPLPSSSPVRPEPGKGRGKREVVRGRSQISDKETAAKVSGRCKGGRGRRRRGSPRPGGRRTGKGFVDLQGPGEIYVGNIDPKISKEDILTWLGKIAERNVVMDFKVNEILTLTKVENPRIRSWKLRVPAQLQEYMLSARC